MATKKTTTGLKDTGKKTTAGTRSTAAKKTGASKTTPKTSGGTRRKTTAGSPSIEEIRKKAGEIYLDRISRGESGNAEDDWLKAEEMLKGEK